MADHFQLRIVTPVRLVLDEVVREVTAPGTTGQFGVLPGHCTFLSSLETGRAAGTRSWAGSRAVWGPKGASARSRQAAKDMIVAG